MKNIGYSCELFDMKKEIFSGILKGTSPRKKIMAKVKRVDCWCCERQYVTAKNIAADISLCHVCTRNNNEKPAIRYIKLIIIGKN